jgi:hypothetical protein
MLPAEKYDEIRDVKRSRGIFAPIHVPSEGRPWRQGQNVFVMLDPLMNEGLEMRDLDACSYDEFIDDLEELLDLRRPMNNEARRLLIRDVLAREADANDLEQVDFVLRMADTILAEQLERVLGSE